MVRNEQGNYRSNIALFTNTLRLVQVNSPCIYESIKVATLIEFNMYTHASISLGWSTKVAAPPGSRGPPASLNIHVKRTEVNTNKVQGLPGFTVAADTAWGLGVCSGQRVLGFRV